MNVHTFLNKISVLIEIHKCCMMAMTNGGVAKKLFGNIEGDQRRRKHPAAIEVRFVSCV